MTGTRKEVADAIIALTYVEMMELCESFIRGVEASVADGVPVDLMERDELADRLRWWAEGHIDALEDEAAKP